MKVHGSFVPNQTRVLGERLIAYVTMMRTFTRMNIKFVLRKTRFLSCTVVAFVARKWTLASVLAFVLHQV